MKKIRTLYQWTTSTPILACILYYSGILKGDYIFQIVAGLLLVFCVMSAVHHSEIIAHRVGEPFGTIIIAVSVTIIEVAIIISLMTTRGLEYATFARDTVYAAVMLILNGIVGLSLFVGSTKFHTQIFSVLSSFGKNSFGFSCFYYCIYHDTSYVHQKPARPLIIHKNSHYLKFLPAWLFK